MKFFFSKTWIRRKVIVTFLLAILVPLLLVGYLSLNAFSKRREAFKQFIESQAWISGETAVKYIEKALQEYEDSVLSPENFFPLSTLNKRHSELDKSSLLSKEKIFVLDADFRIVFPRAGSADVPFVRWEQVLADSPLASFLQRAEYLEFSQEKLTQAAELYQRCILSAPIKQLKAFALERYARCLYAMKKYDEASRAYERMMNEFGQFKNRAGHPYALIAALQLYDMARREQVERNHLEKLIDVLERLRNGEWDLNESTFDYYSQEIKSILERKINKEKYHELYKHFNDILEKPSLYLKEMEFKKLLEEKAIPILKESVILAQYSNEPLKGRLPITCDESYFLISYSRLRDITSDQFVYAGFCWNLDELKNRKIPEIAGSLARASGVQVRMIEESEQIDVSGQKDGNPKDALSVTFRQFPFPWRLTVTQSALGGLRSSAAKENIFLGILLAIILGLMCLGVFLIVRDVSREEEMTRQKSEFVRNISHELKTPLTLIRLYGETLKERRNLPEKSREEAYEVITKESERLSHMINNVLDFSRIESGGKEFNLKKGHLAGVIQETLESYRHHLEKKGFIIQEEICVDLPQMIFDREAIASILINLLSNAMKFSPERKEVSVRLFKNESHAVLQVEDKGRGIPKKEIKKIFRRFYRCDTEAVSDSRGSGLGLTIVKHIAEAHKGRMEVESEPGKGSLFSAILPIG
jgi:signal transduction histidine kinase